MDQFRFLQWEVYRDSKLVVREILSIVRELPREYRFELGSQIIRSAFSIPLNIAEGAGKVSQRELNRFIDVALGSVSETVAALDILNDSQLINKGKFNTLFQKLSSISKQLGGFKKFIKKS